MWLGGMVSRDAALAAADSANNLLWLMNNHNQGSPEAPLAQSRARPGAEPVGAPSADAVSFSQFPIDLQKASQF
jgi:hypothetical protein